MGLSIDGSIVLLDNIISNKMAYLEKSDNKFIKKEVEDLTNIKELLRDSLRMMEYLEEQKVQHINIIKHLQFSYKFLRDVFETQILGKLDVRNIGNIEEWKMELNRLLNTPQNVG